MKPLLVGQAPSRSGSSVALFPLVRGTAGQRLQAMSGVSTEAWFERLETVNTLPEYPGPSLGRGDLVSGRELRQWAALLTATHRMRHRRVLFVGKANAASYDWSHFTGGRMPADPFTWAWNPASNTGAWVWIPHTSGIVRFWNEEENRARVARLFAELLRPEHAWP